MTDDAHSRAVAGRRRRLSGTIEIELGSGKRVRVDNEVDADALRRVLIPTLID
jgi:transposase